MASLIPWAVPILIASKELQPSFSFEIVISSFISSVSGSKIFDSTTAAGADITEAVKRCLAKKSCCSGSLPPRKPM